MRTIAGVALGILLATSLYADVVNDLFATTKSDLQLQISALKSKKAEYKKAMDDIQAKIDAKIDALQMQKDNYDKVKTITVTLDGAVYP